jgi:hypothetical protein
MSEISKKVISILKQATENCVSAAKISQEKGLNPAYVSNIIQKLDFRFKKGLVPKQEYTDIMTAYNKYLESAGVGTRAKGRMTKSVGSFQTENIIGLSKQEEADLLYDADADDAYDERSKGDILRGRSTFKDRHGINIKKITGYKYKILIKGEKALEGSFSREQMDAVYGFYSGMDGAGMTLRAVSREFPHLTYRDFKRILRAFNITKASLPVAPHTMEEMEEDDLVRLVQRNKENTVLKKLEGGRNKYFEKRYMESQREIYDIKSDSEWVDRIVNNVLEKNKGIFAGKVKRMTKSSTSSKRKTSSIPSKPLITIFGDIHYGKKFDNPIYGRGYNRDIAHARIMDIARETVLEAKRKNSPEIVMICMGDIIESALEDGMHPGHYLEMDLFQEEQVDFATGSLQEMIEYVYNNTDVKLTVCFIHGNHDRIAAKRDEDKSRTAGKIVSGFLARLFKNHTDRLTIESPKNNLLKKLIGGICIFAQHGDSSLAKKKPSELINLWGEGNGYYHLLLKGHWHSLKTEEGTNFIAIQAPSVASTDKFIMEELGNNNLPGFIIGSEPEGCRGFDYKKITLY